MVEMGVPVGLGTDATRVASYNPWVALSWLVTGNTVGGLTLYQEQNRLDRGTALRLITRGSAWMSREDDVKGCIAPGQYADFALLSADYFRIPESEIRGITSVLTVVDGAVVFGAEEYSNLVAPLPTPTPEWSPTNRSADGRPTSAATVAHKQTTVCCQSAPTNELFSLWGAGGCGCWAY